MTKKDTTNDMTIQLSVAHVGFGGNAGKGNKFFYAFEQNTIILEKVGINVSIEFSDSTNKELFSIEKIVFGGAQEVLVQGDIIGLNKNSISFHNISSKTCSVEISILCSYQQKDHPRILFNCDPQVLNDPDPD